MTSVYILTFNDPKEKKYYFTTLIAIFTFFDYSKLRVTYGYVKGHNFKVNPVFEGKHITIEKITAISKNDALELKEKTPTGTT